MKKSVLLLAITLILLGTIIVLLTLSLKKQQLSQSVELEPSQEGTIYSNDIEIIYVDREPNQEILTHCNSDSDCTLVSGQCGPYAVNIEQKQIERQIGSTVSCPLSAIFCKKYKPVCIKDRSRCLAVCE